jgi:crotonobetainyl-CoA:carnitine CoA-transferase CaiB-like acyl-CoA transferase
VPALGEHREAILQELGFDHGTIARWTQEGII